jgi:hypothetical protein
MGQTQEEDKHIKPVTAVWRRLAGGYLFVPCMARKKTETRKAELTSNE